MAGENETEGQSDKPMSREEIKEMMAEMVTGALSNHGKRQQAAMQKMLADTLAKIEGAQAIKPENGEQKPAEKEVENALSRKLEHVQKQLEEERQARLQVAEQASRDKARELLRRELEKRNVRPELLDVAVGFISDSKGALKIEDGRPVLAVKRARSRGQSAEELSFDIDEGVEDWLQSDEAKPFLPAPKGTNQHPPRMQTRGSSGRLPAARKPAANVGDAGSLLSDVMSDLGGAVSDVINEVE